MRNSTAVTAPDCLSHEFRVTFTCWYAARLSRAAASHISWWWKRPASDQGKFNTTPMHSTPDTLPRVSKQMVYSTRRQIPFLRPSSFYLEVLTGVFSSTKSLLSLPERSHLRTVPQPMASFFYWTRRFTDPLHWNTRVPPGPSCFLKLIGFLPDWLLHRSYYTSLPWQEASIYESRKEEWISCSFLQEGLQKFITMELSSAKLHCDFE